MRSPVWVVQWCTCHIYLGLHAPLPRVSYVLIATRIRGSALGNTSAPEQVCCYVADLPSGNCVLQSFSNFGKGGSSADTSRFSAPETGDTQKRHAPCNSAKFERAHLSLTPPPPRPQAPTQSTQLIRATVVEVVGGGGQCGARGAWQTRPRWQTPLISRQPVCGMVPARLAPHSCGKQVADRYMGAGVW